jgi:OOP family OmpA-OmpF porin
MLNKTGLLIFILLTIILGTIFYKKECDCTKTTQEVVEKLEYSAIASNTSNSGLFVIYGDNYDYHCNANILFAKSDENYLSPIPDCVNTGLDSLKNYLTLNANTTVAIEAYSLSTEQNNSTYNNLGTARANNLRNYLIGRGFDGNRIIVNGLINDDLANDGTNIVNPISIKVYNQQLTQQQINSFSPKNEVVQGNAAIQSITLQYDDRTTLIKISDQQNQQLSNFIAFATAKLNTKIVITTHSDEQGSTIKNANLAQTRAEFVKDFLKKNSITDDRISIVNKEANEPVADNKSEAGRAKNRRLIISLIQ